MEFGYFAGQAHQDQRNEEAAIPVGCRQCAESPATIQRLVRRRHSDTRRRGPEYQQQRHVREHVDEDGNPDVPGADAAGVLS